jgi:hypothetical protein
VQRTPASTPKYAATLASNRNHRLSRNGGILENAQLMAAHESPHANKLYDRAYEITLDEVDRIAI